MRRQLEFNTPHSPTAVQLAKALKEAARAGVTELEVMRGEAGVIFARQGSRWIVDM